MKKKLFIVFAFIIMLVSCASPEKDRTMIFHIEQGSVSSQEFHTMLETTQEEILFVEIILESSFDSDKYKDMITDDMTKEEIDSIERQLYLEQKSYYKELNEAFANEYLLSTFCDYIEIFEHQSSIELVYYDGNISEEESEMLYNVLEDEMTICVNIYNNNEGK